MEIPAALRHPKLAVVLVWMPKQPCSLWYHSFDLLANQKAMRNNDYFLELLTSSWILAEQYCVEIRITRPFPALYAFLGLWLERH